jgi:hypothetical protein
MTNAYTGGCQCGAVRFRAGAFGRAAICHCRMCQKAFGSFFGPYVTALDFEWTRGAPKYFHSSNAGRRGFCADCGTQLTFEAGGGVELAIGALDDPGWAPPVIEVNPRDKVAFFAALCRLPPRPAAEQPQTDARLARVVSRQHPDRDTDAWPPEAGRS